MHALLDQFFNLGVMVKAFPLLARGLDWKNGYGALS